MANTVSSVTLVHAHGDPPASVAERILRRSAREPVEQVNDLASELARVASAGGKLIVRVESSSGAAATGTVVCDQSNTVAGDYLTFFLPDGSVHVITAVATDAEATFQSGFYSIETATDDATGASFATAVNQLPGLRQWVSASNSSGTVTLTALRPGTESNAINMVKTVGTSAALAVTQFSGGVDHGTKPSATVTFGTPDVAADDTITVGSVVLTWKASPAAEDEIDVDTTPATAAANFASVINAHSQLQGLVTASAASAVVTLTWEGPPRAGELVALSRTETNSGSVVLSGAALDSGCTEAYQADPVTFERGVA